MTPADGISAALTLLIGGIGAYLAVRFKLPGGAIMGSLLPVATSRLLFPSFLDLDDGFRVAAQIMIGIAIGVSLRRDPLRTLRPIIGPLLMFLAVLLGFSTLSAFLLVRLTGLDLATTIFFTSPGGATDMAAAALQLQADAALVAGFHLVRQLAIFLILSTIFSRAFGRRTGGSGPASAAP